MEVDRKTVDEFQVNEIDFQAMYGDVIGRVICKDCKNGENIVASVNVDIRGYARIWVYCNIHGEWTPCVGSSQYDSLGD